MSLRHGLLNLLSVQPMSGYDLSQYFEVSMGNVWPAQHSQIYPELAKLVAEGLIAQTGEGPRGRKEYQTTPEGLEELRSWLRDTDPEFWLRYPALLRVFCLWALPTDEALTYLARYREQFVGRMEHMQQALTTVDWGAFPETRASRLSIEFGLRFQRMQLEWVDWAAEQVAAGILQPGGPLPVEPVG